MRIKKRDVVSFCDKCKAETEFKDCPYMKEYQAYCFDCRNWTIFKIKEGM